MENYKGEFKKLTYDSLWFDIDHIRLKPTLCSTINRVFSTKKYLIFSSTQSWKTVQEATVTSFHFLQICTYV